MKKVLLNVFLVSVVMVAGCGHRLKTAGMTAIESRSADLLPRYGLLELSLKHNGKYDNIFFGVSLDALFTSPVGKYYRVKGFYYGSDLWKVRFRPDEPGPWTYTYVMASRDGFYKQGGGKFYCVPSNTEGPVRRNPKNPYHWTFPSGKPYFPIGLQDCFRVRGSHFGSRAIDGETREEGGRKISTEEYFSIYGQAGFNLFRFSHQNCSYSLYDDLDHYRKAESLATDELLALARKHGFRIMFGFFGFHNDQSGKRRDLRNPEVVEKEKRFIDYCVARWGVYVDFWELLNERNATDEWTTLMANYVRSVDPDRKPVSTSWQKPRLSAVDINAPHWYESEDELRSDQRVCEQAAKWKRDGKPVIVGEQGNTGMNWDPRSGLRMRIRAWTALFQEISFVFWNTSWSKAGMFHGRYTPGGVANIYLGPEERGYIRVLQNFASRLDAGVKMVSVQVSEPSRIRAYGLLSGKVAAVYLHHSEDHCAAIREAKVILDLPASLHSKEGLIAEWIEPSTGTVLGRTEAFPGRQSLNAPPFTVDTALLVTLGSRLPMGGLSPNSIS